MDDGQVLVIIGFYFYFKKIIRRYFVLQIKKCAFNLFENCFVKWDVLVIIGLRKNGIEKIFSWIVPF